MTVTDTNALIDELANRFWEKILELDPLQATILGDDRFDDRLPDLSPERNLRNGDAQAGNSRLTGHELRALADPDRQDQRAMLGAKDGRFHFGCRRI